jgi:hypothetical protein
MDDLDRVTGWWLFAGIMLLISGTLNIIWGIAAISESHFFALNTHYILSSLNTWGWITLILGALEILAAFSLFGGGSYGRWFGMIAAGLVAIASLMDISAYPFWSLCVFALSVIILYQLAKGPSSEATQQPTRQQM